MDGSEFITKQDLEEFKKQLLCEMKAEEVSMKEVGGNQLLKPVYNKWIHDSTAYPIQKPFKQIYGLPYPFRVWDAIRKLTCVVCGSNTVANIVNKEMALDYCEKLCEFTYNYVVEQMGEKGEK